MKLLLAAALLSLVCWQAHGARELSAEQKARQRRALEPLHAQYDPAERMLRQPFSSPGYHTTLKGGTVHPTRSALQYAVALLDTGEEPWRQRAMEILRRVIALQDQNPESKTYGIWPWFLEEPLERMSPPDWNWADFCGVALLQARLEHADRLDPEFLRQIDAAIRHAARSIQRRNVGPGYTNIAIMGSYVTLVTAELYGLKDLREYALARWRRFYEYTKRQGAFTEYNSPTYTVVALKELARMRQQVRDPEARRLTEEIYRLAWEEIARHFHAPTRQWAGPHSRCYSTLVRGDGLALIQRATGGRVSFGADQASLDEHRLALDCPRELESFFTELKAPREIIQTFVRDEPAVIGTTFLHPVFALGSVNRGDLWNQRRALVAYWGTAEKPAYLHLRCLHDDYDFAAAQFFSAQREGAVLAGVNFAIDGGDRHVSLDRIKNARFRARDLRLRFEFGGAAREKRPTAPASLAERARLRFGDVRVGLAAPYARFGEQEARWEAGGDGTRAWLDVVFYSGAEREIDLTGLSQAVAGLAVEFAVGDIPDARVAAECDEGRLRLAWRDLRLELPGKPAQARDLQRAPRTGRKSD